MIYTAVDNFYLSREQLEASPSRADGVDAATEAELRRYCCDVVAEAAVLLRLPQVVAATAQVLVQRFYCKRSLKKFDVKVLAMAAFWLAAKLEEVIEIDNPQKLTLRNVITVIDRVTRRREGHALAVLDPYSQKYEELKQQTTKFERLMLRAFGFVVHVEHPHRFVLNYCQMLMRPGDPKQRVLQQEAWNMANDSLRTPLCVRFKSEVVACGILFTAARKLQIPLPEDPPWWALFEVQEEQLVEVCTTLCDLYRQPRPKNVALAPAARPALPPLPAGARSPLQLTPPLRSPASQPRSAGTNLGSLLVVQRKGSEGEAPSIAQQQRSGAAAGEPSVAGANGSAAAPGGDAKPLASDKQEKDREADSKSDRCRRSASRSRSRSKGRGAHSRRRHSRSRSRSRSPGGERGGGDRGKRRRSSSRSPGKDSGRDRRDDRRRGERRDDQAIFRPGASRPPRRDERRREDHRERDHRGSGGHRR